MQPGEAGGGWPQGWLDLGIHQSVDTSSGLLSSLSAHWLCPLHLHLLSSHAREQHFKHSDSFQLSNRRRELIFPSSFSLKHPGTKLRLVSLTKIFQPGCVAEHFRPIPILPLCSQYPCMESPFLSWAYYCPVNAFAHLRCNQVWPRVQLLIGKIEAEVF